MEEDQIAKAKKPFTIVEELILPAVMYICSEMLGKTTANKIGHAPLSASNVTRRIEDVAENIEIQLLQRIDEPHWYALQVDVSTDVENKAVHLVYVR